MNNVSAFEINLKEQNFLSKSTIQLPNVKNNKHFNKHNNFSKPLEKDNFSKLVTQIPMNNLAANRKKQYKLVKDRKKLLKTLLKNQKEVKEIFLPHLSNTKLCNPLLDSQNIFQWLIYPLKKEEFFENYWEIQPVHIKRSKKRYYNGLISSIVIDKILRKNNVLFTKNVDITTFVNDQRETHNPPGRALPSIVWDYYINGCSVRLINPHLYLPKLHTINVSLQEYFNCFVGVNCYLTPPKSQGFAPHYDDIEAFIIQIEGKKRWRLYKPKNNQEILPQYSSSNLSQNDLGEPILDTVVHPGDVLYFPRGTIHQGDTHSFNSHSLHLTLSVYQKNSWGDFLEKLMNLALQNAIKNDVRFRKGLPLDYLRYFGFAFTDHDENNYQEKFSRHLKTLLNILLTKYINIDKSADEMAKKHIHDFLPPMLNNEEYINSAYGGGEKMIKTGVITNLTEIIPSTSIRLSRAHCVRLIQENDCYKLYYSCENSKDYHEYDIQYLEVDLELVPAIKQIILRFPLFIKVKNLLIVNMDKKVQVAKDLWEKGIVICNNSTQWNNQDI